MCKLKRPLGRRQLWALNKLLNGWHISECEMLNTHDIMLVDDEKANFIQFDIYLLKSLMNRELLEMRIVYTTVQPDSFHYRYRIKKECIELVRAIVNQKDKSLIEHNRLNICGEPVLK
jgi:hypothetical protein